jgi:membrane protease YdiL (CAAX protease family)
MGVTKMTANTRRQLIVLGVLVAVYALLAAVTYLFIPWEQLTLSQAVPVPEVTIPRWQLALANAGIVVVLYGLLGLAGVWLARRLGLPGAFRPDAGWRQWLLHPMLLGLALGVTVVFGDRIFAALQNWAGFPHPPFPFSLIASATAAIGEEILFRSFVLGLWAFVLHLVLRRWQARGVALWLGNLLAALVFAAGHLGSAMLLFGAASPAGIPPLLLAEIFLINGAVGLVAGAQYIRQGLVAAIGVHFWVDVAFRVVSPLIGPGT